MNKKSLLSLIALLLVAAAAAEAQSDSVKIVDLESGEESIAPLIPPRPFPPIGPVPICRKLPDLVVKSLPPPIYDSVTRGSIIKAVIRNQGFVASRPFVARLVVDRSTVVNVAVGGLAAGASTIVTFRIPFWVYNPDASYVVSVDATQRVLECNEKNNSKSFFGLG